jgi:hypothetical protein
MKQAINLNDLSFYPDKSSSRFYESKYIEWDRSNSSKNNIQVFTDFCLKLADLNIHKDKYKVALIIEPEVINPNSYKYMLSNYHKFDLVLIHHKKYLDQIPNSKYYFFGGSWIEEKDWRDYNKTKLVSMIASNKNFTYGHSIRHDIAKEFKNEIDLFGSGYKPIDNKLEGLRDYKFQIVVENCKEEGYHTEKIIDCFATHTVPIYFGGDSINEIFDKNGILCFNNLKDLKRIITSLNSELYDKCFDASERNFHIAKEYRCAEDKIFENYLAKLVV